MCRTERSNNTGVNVSNILKSLFVYFFCLLEAVFKIHSAQKPEGVRASFVWMNGHDASVLHGWNRVQVSPCYNSFYGKNKSKQSNWHYCVLNYKNNLKSYSILTCLMNCWTVYHTCIRGFGTNIVFVSQQLNLLPIIDIVFSRLVNWILSCFSWYRANSPFPSIFQPCFRVLHDSDYWNSPQKLGRGLHHWIVIITKADLSRLDTLLL